MKTILVAVDFSEITTKVISTSLEYAKLISASIRLLHVAEPAPEFWGERVGPKVIRDIKAELLKQEHTQINELAIELKEKGIDVIPHVIQGATIDIILEQAKKYSVILIILGSKGRGAIKKAIMGSVCEGVVKDAQCPVMILPHTLSLTN